MILQKSLRFLLFLNIFNRCDVTTFIISSRWAQFYLEFLLKSLIDLSLTLQQILIDLFLSRKVFIYLFGFFISFVVKIFMPIILYS